MPMSPSRIPRPTGPLPSVSTGLTEDWTSTNSAVQTWIYVTDDGGEDLVASAESSDDGGTIKIARVSRSDATSFSGLSASDWHVLFKVSDLTTATGFTTIKDTFACPTVLSGPATYTGVSDHYHIYAQGYHWIACSITWEGDLGDGVTKARNVSAILIRFTVDSTGVPADINAVQVFAPASTSDYYYDTTTSVYRQVRPTNDLFMCEDEADGTALIAVGISHAPSGTSYTGGLADDQGHTIYRFVVDLTPLVPDIAFYGVVSGEGFEHCNEASAVRGGAVLSTPVPAIPGVHPAGAHGERQILAPETVASRTEGSILRMVGDSGWSPEEREVFLEADTNNQLAMAQLVSVGLMSTSAQLLVYRRTEWSSLMIAPLLPSDYGYIELQLRSRAGEVRHTYTLSEEGNRPHLLVSDGRLYVAWDETDGVHLATFDISLDWYVWAPDDSDPATLAS